MSKVEALAYNRLKELGGPDLKSLRTVGGGSKILFGQLFAKSKPRFQCKMLPLTKLLQEPLDLPGRAYKASKPC